ncbi:hypothetical protein ACMFMG_007663 [Clarireedia jacksonii]
MCFGVLVGLLWCPGVQLRLSLKYPSDFMFARFYLRQERILHFDVPKKSPKKGEHRTNKRLHNSIEYHNLKNISIRTNQYTTASQAESNMIRACKELRKRNGRISCLNPLRHISSGHQSLYAQSSSRIFQIQDNLVTILLFSFLFFSLKCWPRSAKPMVWKGRRPFFSMEKRSQRWDSRPATNPGFTSTVEFEVCITIT